MEQGDLHLGNPNTETPMREGAFDKSNEEKIAEIEGYFTKIMDTLGLDLTDDSPVWYVLSKPEWMSPAVSSFAISNAEMLDYLQLHFRHLSSSVCIARMNFHPAEGMTPAYWDEHERWMIVADEWVQG